MNLNTILKKIIYLIGLVVITIPADAFVVGYTKLKCRNVQIDLLYDIHLPGPVSTSRLSQLSYEAAKSMCFPTEQRFLTALENIDRKHEVDLIWENDYTATHQNHSQFIAFAYPLIRYRFSTINHVLADNARPRFLNLFNVTYPARDVPRTNYNLHDYHNPYVLSYDLRNKILGNWDGFALDRLNEFMNQAFVRVKSYFAPYFNNGRFVDYDDQIVHLSHLADVEMLSHILASQKQRIIVYTGAAHARRLVPFLRSLNFVEEEHYDNGNWIPLSPDQLNSLDRDCLSVSRRTSNPLSAMPTVVSHYPIIPAPRRIPAAPAPAPTAPVNPVPAPMPVVTTPIVPLPAPVRSGGMPVLPVSGGRRSTKIAPRSQSGRGRQQRSSVTRRKMIGVIVKRAMTQKNNAGKLPISRRGKQIIRRAPAQMRGKNAGNKNRRTVGVRANGRRKRR